MNERTEIPEKRPAHDLARGMAVIRALQETLPEAPGVYRMIGADGGVLYVGKAKSLRVRVAAYAKGKPHADRLTRMIAETHAMEFVTTQSEAEALLLEASLIKSLRPRYNVLLKDDRSLPFILVAGENGRAERLSKHRGARTKTGTAFGPFLSHHAVDETISVVQRAFGLRTCEDAAYDNRTRPCLLFQIKRCSAPCTGEIAPQDYAQSVAEAQAFLSGRSHEVVDRLSREMHERAEALDFEAAARIRDRLSALATIRSRQSVTSESVREADIVAIAEEAGRFCVEVFFYRDHQNRGNRAYFPRVEGDAAIEDVLGAFLMQFYADKPPPRLVLLSHAVPDAALVAQALAVSAGRRVAVGVPRRGERRRLVEVALANATGALSRALAERASQTSLVEALASALHLSRVPRRIEIYDNSHTAGTNAVGAMVVAGREGFAKAHYRTFTIKDPQTAPGDDFAMMEEVLRRRFARLGTSSTVEGEGTSDEMPERPDLVLIDGGAGQTNVARRVLADLGLTDIAIVGIAKGVDRDAGRETFFVEGREPFRMPPRDPALYFVQRLRDEAHRFAIGTHRAKRGKTMRANPLDEISGIGPARKRALLSRFGSSKAIAEASLEELAAVPGVNRATARKVYDHFRS